MIIRQCPCNQSSSLSWFKVYWIPTWSTCEPWSWLCDHCPLWRHFLVYSQLPIVSLTDAWKWNSPFSVENLKWILRFPVFLVLFCCQYNFNIIVVVALAFMKWPENIRASGHANSSLLLKGEGLREVINTSHTIPQFHPWFKINPPGHYKQWQKS